MWPFKGKQVSSLTEELVQRVWDINGRLEQLEGNIKAHLEELSRRYKRAEQGELRLDKKREEKGCEDCEDDAPSERTHPAIASLKRRRHSIKRVS